MSIHTILVTLKNGEKFTRTEWGRTRKAAMRTLRGIYGDNIVALAWWYQPKPPALAGERLWWVSSQELQNCNRNVTGFGVSICSRRSLWGGRRPQHEELEQNRLEVVQKSLAVAVLHDGNRHDWVAQRPAAGRLDWPQPTLKNWKEEAHMTREERDKYMRLMDEYLNSPYRRCREYGRYLRRYFDPAEARVDGMPYQARIENSKPMPYTVYFFNWRENCMKLCKNMTYYVRVIGKPYTFGRATRDMLTAQVNLSEARRLYPGEEWGIVAMAWKTVNICNRGRCVKIPSRFPMGWGDRNDNGRRGALTCHGMDTPTPRRQKSAHERPT